MRSLRNNDCLKVDIQKVDQNKANSWLIYGTKRRLDNHQWQGLEDPCRISKLRTQIWHEGIQY